MYIYVYISIYLSPYVYMCICIPEGAKKWNPESASKRRNWTQAASPIAVAAHQSQAYVNQSG